MKSDTGKNGFEGTDRPRNKQSWIIAALVIAITAVMAPSLSHADQPVVVIANRDGKITAIYETAFQIDHRTYSLTPDAVILDRHGDPLTTSDFRVDIEVKYHLLKGTTDKIDQIVLYLPL